MSFKTNISLALITFFAVHSANAIETNSKTIERIQINAQEEGKAYYFIYNSSGWGVCHSSQGVYVRFKEGVPGSQAMLSASLAAKATGRTVKFAGECLNNSIFDAKYMYLE